MDWDPHCDLFSPLITSLNSLISNTVTSEVLWVGDSIYKVVKDILGNKSSQSGELVMWTLYRTKPKILSLSPERKCIISSLN